MKKPPDERVRSIPGKKDTRKWCKGVVGREHTPEIVIPDNRAGWELGSCNWATVLYPWYYNSGGDWPDHWYCMHVEQCTTCMKFLNSRLRERCPDYKEKESDDRR